MPPFESAHIVLQLSKRCFYQLNHENLDLTAITTTTTTTKQQPNKNMISTTIIYHNYNYNYVGR